ncbi:MAG TPA: glycosyltransferase family 4 protein, partial [Isosphaeraceae bacterium]|nr:glycosyltransferase family 4 protein [Isosphaeraceae bacterium]
MPAFVSPGEAPLSVAYVSPGWPADMIANGVAHYISEISGGLRQNGHRALILAQQVAAGDASADVHDLGAASPTRTPARRRLDGLSYRIAPDSTWYRQVCRAVIAEARRAALERGIQLIEMEEAFGWPRLVKSKVPIPMIVRLHGPWFIMGPLRGARDDAAFRRRVRHEGEAIRLADGVSATSQDILDRTRAYYGLPLEDAVAIPPPAPIVPDSECWRLAECDPHRILFVGRFDRHKGGDILIDAFAQVASSFPEARLQFVGPDLGLIDDDQRRWTITEYLRARLPAGVLPRVEWMGQQPNTALRALRCQALITVVCSRFENVPTTVLEAMIQGCPLVASDAGGIPEIVVDGVNGLLCRSGDAADLAAKLGDLLKDPARAERLGPRARHDCEARLGPAALAGRMAAFYCRV